MALKRFLGSILSGTPPTVGSSGFEDSAASGRWTPSSILSFIKDSVWPTQGVTPTFTDDVFSTDLYEGTNASRTITNGIDLNGKGGLVWLKALSETQNHALYDTERGATKSIYSSTTDAEGTLSGVSAFNSNGFDLGTFWNSNNQDYVAWTFRKAAGFFDIQTWTGDGSSTRDIAHNLGSTPGMILVKITSNPDNWNVYHKSLNDNSGNPYFLHLNLSNAQDTGGGNFTTMSDTTFGVRTNINTNGYTYVAYLFASEDARFGLNKDQSIIKCGSYTGNGSNEHFIDTGFEPHWVLIKRADAVGHWWVYDYQRQMGVREGTGNLENQVISPNNSVSQEYWRTNQNGTNNIEAHPTGFRIGPHENDVNYNGGTFIYMAIRMPMKVPTAGTEVYAAAEFADVNNGTSGSTSIMPDMIWSKRYDAFSDWAIQDRTRGLPYRNAVNTFTWLMNTTGDDIKQYPDIYKIQSNGDFTNGQYWHGTNIVRWFFKRAPGFLDIVTYEGNATTRTITHNLGREPKIMIVKHRTDSGYYTYVYHKEFSNYGGSSPALYLRMDSNTNAAATSAWNSTEPTSTVFSLGTDSNVNTNAKDFVAYLFGDVAGVSKCGYYAGTGNAVDVDCGFSSGARFVWIKRIDAAGDWFIFDSTRGIVAGNDPYLRFNERNGESEGSDYIDPLSSGFTIPAGVTAHLNANGGKYVFWAVA